MIQEAKKVKRRGKLNCIDIQKNITAFIKDELNSDILEEFLEHVRNCPSCQEELEVYYTILASIQLLDEDKEVEEIDLNRRIRQAEETLRRRKIRKVGKRLIMSFFVIVIFLFLEH